MKHNQNNHLDACQHDARHSEKGNVFILILLGIVLFSGLAYTVSQGFHSQTTDSMSDRDAQLLASDLMSYAQGLQRGVNVLRRRGVSESDISFDNNVVSGYAHSSAQPTSHQVFHPDGGAMSWRSPPERANDGSEWIISGANCVVDLNHGGSGCDSDSDTSNEELLLILNNVDQDVCLAINEKLSVDTIPANSGDAFSTTVYKGSFSNGSEIDVSGGPYNAICTAKSGSNSFYFALLER